MAVTLRGVHGMGTEWLGSLLTGRKACNISDFLRQSPYDELVEFDLPDNSCRNLYHVEGKYYVPFQDTSMDDMYRFAPENMVHPEDRAAQRAFMDTGDMAYRLKTSPTPGILEMEARFKLRDGGWRWTREILVSGEENGLPEGIVHLYIFDTQQVHDREAGKTVEMALPRSPVHVDELTGLSMDRDLLPMARRKLREVRDALWCVLSIDIEHYKLFIDWHGWMDGDILLSEIAKVLKNMATETGGLAGYHGADNFWLVVPYDRPAIRALYEKLSALIASHSSTVGFQPIIGICVAADPDAEVADLFNHAAMAIEQARGSVHNRIRVYNASAYNKIVEEYRLLSDFQRGMENGEVFFCLQPQCKMSNGKVIGAEALARWRKADGTMVSPAHFVPILEEHGVVVKLDQFIWEAVCKWLHRWIAAGHTAVPVSMNISQIDILNLDVPACFKALLEKYALPPDLIKAEITESAYVSDTAVVRETVRRLRELGLLVLMDDFGSGASSLNMLRSLNVDVLKLDAQFLRIQNQDERKGISILESVISMAKTMHMPIIVEGVETQEQIKFLSDLGCRYMQGYFFHRPMPVEEFEKMLLDEHKIDIHGIQFKGNEQLHTREFLDENVFSDAMLNNILGAVAIYRCKNGNVDIERYNEQFFQMVGIPVRMLNARIASIEQYIHPDDVPAFFRLLDIAVHDHLNGAKGVVRVYRPNKTLRWISLRLYYLNEDEKGQHFYGASEDVTELQYINTAIPGGYFRVASDGSWRIDYVSRVFQDMVGYTEQEIREQFGNRLTALIYEGDRQTLIDRMNSFVSGQSGVSPPYRMKHKTRGYIYVVIQAMLIELSGELSYMCIATDVTDVMAMRNRMRLLSNYLADTIIFLGKDERGWHHHVVVHGMEEKLGMDASALETALDNYSFYYWVRTDDAVGMTADIAAHLQKDEPFEMACDMTLPNGHDITLRMRMDTVNDAQSSIKYICVLRAA